MSKKRDLDAFLEEEGNAIEADADAPITDATKVTRGHTKTRTLQVRLSPEEYEGLEKLADERGLPVSTVAREQLQHLLRSAHRSQAASRVVSALDEFFTDLDRRKSSFVVQSHPVQSGKGVTYGEPKAERATVLAAIADQLYPPGDVVITTGERIFVLHDLESRPADDSAVETADPNGGPARHPGF